MAKVMLVEDDTNLSEIYQARMAAEGYEIVTAHDGEEALATAAKEKPDLIISDVMMPKISGFEMLDILRNTDGLKTTKVIMLTALGQADDKTRAQGLGADRYLVKSQVTLEDIVKAAQELIGSDNAVAATTPNTAPAPDFTPQPTATAIPAPVPMPVAPAPTPTVVPAPVPVPTPVPAAPVAPVPVPQPVPAAPAPAPVAPPATALAEPPSAPLVPEPTPTPAPVAPAPPVPPTPADSATATDDKLVSNAAAALQAVAQSTAPEPSTPQVPAAPTTSSDPSADMSNGTITHKKVISPLDDSEKGEAKPTLQDLLVAEEQKNPQVPNTSGNGLPHQPGNVVAPTTAPAAPLPNGHLDPNSVAL